MPSAQRLHNPGQQNSLGGAARRTSGAHVLKPDLEEGGALTLAGSCGETESGGTVSQVRELIPSFQSLLRFANCRTHMWEQKGPD